MLGRRQFLSLLVFLRRLGVGVLTAYVTVSLTLGGTPYAKAAFHGAALAWIVVLSVATSLRSRWINASDRAQRSGALRSTLELLLTNVMFSVLFAEVCLQVAGACLATSLLTHSSLDAHRLRPGHDYGGGLRGNMHGYPGRELPTTKAAGVFRIAALGDSFAVGPAAPFADNYLSLLENQRSGVEICNFGVSGAGPREYLEILQRDVWQVQPDLVLISIFVGNDITEALPRPHGLDPRRHATYLLCTRGWQLLRERHRTAHELGERQRLPTLSRETFREVEARRLAVCVTPPSAAMEKKWQRALKRLDDIIRECRGRQVPVAFVLIPDEFQVNPAVLADALADAVFDPSVVDIELPQRRLLRFCAERAVPCLDLLPTFKGRADTYAPHDTHWNVRGNHLAAECIAEWLRSCQSRDR